MKGANLGAGFFPRGAVALAKTPDYAIALRVKEAFQLARVILRNPGTEFLFVLAKGPFQDLAVELVK
jgi:hypothetical protein